MASWMICVSVAVEYILFVTIIDVTVTIGYLSGIKPGIRGPSMVSGGLMGLMGGFIYMLTRTLVISWFLPNNDEDHCITTGISSIRQEGGSMAMAKFDIEKFNGKNDFAPWRMKMRALLVQQGLEEALEGERKLPTTLSEREKKDIMNKEHNAIILCLGDKVLREMSKEKTDATIWLKLENLYMTKTLANRLYLKQRLYTLKMQSGTSITDHIDEFNRLILDLENIDVKLEDEDQALLLIRSLTSSYDVLADTLIYGREAITLEEVQATLMAKELSKKSEGKEHNAGGESLMIRGRTEKKEGKGKNRSRSKSRTKFKCFICHKGGHFKKNCPEKKTKKQNHSEDSGDASVASDGYDSSELFVASNTQGEADWVANEVIANQPKRKVGKTKKRIARYTFEDKFFMESVVAVFWDNLRSMISNQHKIKFQ